MSAATHDPSICLCTTMNDYSRLICHCACHRADQAGSIIVGIGTIESITTAPVGTDPAVMGAVESGAFATVVADGDGHLEDLKAAGDVPVRFLGTLTPAGELLPLVTSPGPLLGVHRRSVTA